MSQKALSHAAPQCRGWGFTAVAASLVLVVAGPAAAWSADREGAPTRRVVFADGRSLDVVAVKMEEGQAFLTLTEGDMIAIPTARVRRVEQIPAAEPAPAQTPTPASDRAAKAAPGPGAEPASRSGDLETIIREAAARHGLEVDLLAAVIAVESGYRSDAISSKGAQGLMQLMPATARELKVTDPLDPRQNIDAGARYLKQLLDAHDGQYWKALAAYNAGMGRVARYDGLPPYRETIRYIEKVLDLYVTPRTIPGSSSK